MQFSNLSAIYAFTFWKKSQRNYDCLRFVPVNFFSLTPTQFFLGKSKLTLLLILGNRSGHFFFLHYHITEAHWVGPIFKLAHQFWFSYPPPGAGGSTSKFILQFQNSKFCYDFLRFFFVVVVIVVNRSLVIKLALLNRYEKSNCKQTVLLVFCYSSVHVLLNVVFIVNVDVVLVAVVVVVVVDFFSLLQIL